MSHYFENDPNVSKEEFPIHFELGGKSFTVLSSSGVFSSSKLDTGTRILCTYLVDHVNPAANVLDLGCGIGVIGVILSAFWHCKVTGIDPNGQACHLARENYQAAHVDGIVLEQDHLNDQQYDLIVLNPPIRTGKKTIYSLFEQSAAHLVSGGSLWIVIRKQHGAQSAMEYLESLHLEVIRHARDKGFWVVQARKPQQDPARSKNGKGAEQEPPQSSKKSKCQI